MQKHSQRIAYQYALKASHALNILGQEGTESWLQSSLDVYFADGLYAALQVIKNLDLFIEQQQRGLALTEIRGVLQNFLYGLDGRALEIRSSDNHYTDTEQVYLPELVDRFELEALLLLSEVLQTLDDRYAIYGFSGMTRKRCELYKLFYTASAAWS